MKKRMIPCVLLVLAMILAFSGCGKSTPAGSWKVDHYLVNGEEVSCEAIAEVTDDKDYAKWNKTAFVFKSDGNVKATWPTQGDDTKTQTHTYHFDSDVGRIQIFLTEEGDTFEVMYLEEDCIRYPLNSTVSIIFKK